MKRFLGACALSLTLATPLIAQGTPLDWRDEQEDSDTIEMRARIWDGMRRMYTDPKLLVPIGVAAALTHTLDEEFRTAYQNDIRGHEIDEFSSQVKNLGNGQYLLPALWLAREAGKRADSPWLKEWSERSLVTIAVGAPAVLGTQRLLGASRPGDDLGPGWRPFKDSNGSSGHAFLGAVPFLTAADMTRNKPAKFALYAASTLVGLSRVNDDKHYLSQVALGYGLAVFANRATRDEQPAERRYAVGPLVMREGVGLNVTVRF